MFPHVGRAVVANAEGRQKSLTLEVSMLGSRNDGQVPALLHEDEDLERNDPEAARSLRKMYETSLDQAVDLI